jgi:hypothetical protein
MICWTMISQARISNWKLQLSISAMERFVAQKSTDKVRMNDAYMRIGDAFRF